MLHVYPKNDERPHDTESTACPCHPRVEFYDPDTGIAYREALVIHNAFDCREVVEHAEAIKQAVEKQI